MLDPTGTGTVSKARLMDTMDRLDIICTDEHMIDELFERIQGGAHLYVCGLKGMLPGIEAMLSDGAVARGLDGAKFLKGLKKKKQLHVEVY